MAETNTKKRIYYSGRYRATIYRAYEKLRHKCIKAAQEKYGKPLPGMVKNRLVEELEPMKFNLNASDYLIGAMITEESEKRGYPVSSRGMISSSFLAYLCKLSAVNPLPAHYYCPCCHHFELYENRKKEYHIMGYDLPDKTCPECGKVMIAEGIDAESEIAFGIKHEKETEICMNVAPGIRAALAEYLQKQFGVNNVYRAGVRVVLEDGSILRGIHPGGIYLIREGLEIRDVTSIRKKIPENDLGLKVTERDYHDLSSDLKKYDLLPFPELEMLKLLQEETGISALQIKTNDKEVLKLFLDEGFSFLSFGDKDFGIQSLNRVISQFQPRCFSELCRINGLMHGVGTWLENGEYLIHKQGMQLSSLIAFRDDIFQELLTAGIKRDKAYEIMNNVRLGKGLSEDEMDYMKYVGIPTWYIGSCNRIRYIYPKSHAAEYTLLAWRIAYYKRYYPKEYEKVFHIVMDKTQYT